MRTKQMEKKIRSRRVFFSEYIQISNVCELNIEINPFGINLKYSSNYSLRLFSAD